MRVFFCEKVTELQELPPDEQDEILRVTGFQEFVRLNFGLYAPPGDYRALRAENLRRSLDPHHISRRPSGR